MNPFHEKPVKGTPLFWSWEQLCPAPYEPDTADPYTRTRVILMNGTEFENVWFSHQTQRSCPDNELRRQMAVLRRSEQQQQKLLTHLKPAGETALEHTIGYEQLAVDLTAHLAQRVKSPDIRNALDFALLEDFDHLYRYADYLDASTGRKAEDLVGRYTEIMPGRPTIAHHRHPEDSVRRSASGPALIDLLAANVITAAEQQTMNYYMNTAALWQEETGRRLYQEIGMVEEQHVTQYGSLLDPGLTMLENLLTHQYVECWLYWSCAETETDPALKRVWEALFQQELLHLDMAREMLERWEGKQWQQVLPQGEFPPPLRLESNIPYVRRMLEGTVHNTALEEDYCDARSLPPDSRFAQYQKTVNTPLRQVVSHSCLADYIRRNGQDYRFETGPHPVPALQDRTADNTTLGRPGKKS